MIDTHCQTPSPSLVGGCAAALKRQPQWQQLGRPPPRSSALQGSYYRHNCRVYRGHRLDTISNLDGQSQWLVTCLRPGKVVLVAVEVARTEVYLS